MKNEEEVQEKMFKKAIVRNIFWISFSTIWFGSSAAGAKCIIDYSKVIWEEEAKKRGDKLVG